MRHSDHLIPRASFVFVAAILGACEVGEPNEDGDDPSEADDADDDATAEIIENLRAAGFPESEIALDADGVVMVGGDAVVTLAASRELAGLDDADQDGASFRQYRTSWPMNGNWNHTICIDGTTFDDVATLDPALDGAIEAYNAQNLRFTLVRTNGWQAGCNSLITGQRINGVVSSSGFPSGNMPYGTIRIANGTLPFGEDVTRHVIMHELGHCFGFRHADYYNRAISCGGTANNEGAGASGAVQIGNTPSSATADGSVMNACWNATSPGTFAGEDLDALHQLWGNNCCVAGSGAGCGDVLVNECVGAVDPYCNDTWWDSICVDEVASLGCGSCATNCCIAHGTPWCDDGYAHDGVTPWCVCELAGDPYCCEVAWDQQCASEVVSNGCGNCG
jgi:Dual-action HEIGH metallo-peptidase